jgi:hypothetical protein
MLQMGLAWSQLRLEAPADAARIARQLRESAEASGLDALRDEATLIEAFAGWLSDPEPQAEAKARAALTAAQQNASLMSLALLVRIPALREAATRDAALAEALAQASHMVARSEPQGLRHAEVVAPAPIPTHDVPAVAVTPVEPEPHVETTADAPSEEVAPVDGVDA